MANTSAQRSAEDWIRDAWLPKFQKGGPFARVKGVKSALSS